MEALVVTGGKPLAGTIETRGSKNAILPLIAASLLSSGPVSIENVPEITDVSVMVELIRGLGAKAEWDLGSRRLVVLASDLSSASPDASLVRKLRASILLCGALLGRLRRAELPYPGGDAIGSRPISAHLAALRGLGVEVTEGNVLSFDGTRLSGSDLTLEETSVTATENTILAAVLAPGRTAIRLAAFEPHVQELVRFLAALGARIRWINDSAIAIEGVGRLGGGAFLLHPDELEVSGFAALAAATRSELAISGIEPRYLDAVFLQLRAMDVTYEVRGRALRIGKPAKGYRASRIQSGLYPKLGSDHLPPFAVLATQAEGISLIHDWLYEGRLRYLRELAKMGATITLLDPHRALITGPTPLWGTRLDGLDIRSGMTLVIAALVAEGETVISGAEHLDRGYERLDERLRAIGADIKRVTV